VTEENSGTNCLECERYKKLGDVCVIEHGKKFLWEFCRDYEQEVILPDYKELMNSVRKELATERKKIRDKKRRERALFKRQKAMEQQAALSRTTPKRTGLEATKISKRNRNTLSSVPLESLRRRKIPLGTQPGKKSKLSKITTSSDKESNSKRAREGNRALKGNETGPRSGTPADVQAKMPKTASSARATA